MDRESGFLQHPNSSLIVMAKRLHRRRQVAVFCDSALDIFVFMGIEVSTILVLLIAFWATIDVVPPHFWLPGFLMKILVMTAFLYAVSQVLWYSPSPLQVLRQLDEDHRLFDLLGTAYTLAQENVASPQAARVIQNATTWLRDSRHPKILSGMGKKLAILPIILVAFLPWVYLSPAPKENLSRVDAESACLPAQDIADSSDAKREDKSDAEERGQKSTNKAQDSRSAKGLDRQRGSENTSSAGREAAEKLACAGENSKADGSDQKAGGQTEIEMGRNSEDQKTLQGSYEESSDEDSLKNSGSNGKSELAENTGEDSKVEKQRENSRDGKTGTKAPAEHAPEEGNPGGANSRDPEFVVHHLKPLFGEGEEWFSRQFMETWLPSSGEEGEEGKLDSIAYQKFIHQAEAFFDSSPIPEKHRRASQRYFTLIRPADK